MDIQNYNRNSLVSGSEDNDSIYNTGYTATINALGGDDTISNYGGDVSILGGAGNDSINNGAYNVTINPGAGNDSINNRAYNVTFQYNPGDGNDLIRGFRSDSSLSISGSYYATTSSGNDIIVYVGEEKITLNSGNTFNFAGRTIVGNSKHGILVENSYSFTNEQDNVVIVGNEVDNGITNHRKNVTIAGGAGNDEIINGDAAVRSSLIGGTGNDTFYNNGASSTIEGGEGNDYIFHSSHSPEVLISGGDGSDTVQNLSSNVTIKGDAGNDSIKNDGSKVKIDGGEDNDLIENYGSNDSISGSKGDDTISLSSDAQNNLIEYRAGDGNDLILGFNDTSTLDIGEENSATLIRSGDDIFVRFGDSEITLRGAANLSKINILGFPDAILNTLNTADNVSIVGGRYDDSIRNAGSNVTILAQDGKDSVWNENNNVTIDGGDDNDSINNLGMNVRILAQGGNDSIENKAANVTISGGAGDDSVYNNEKLVTIEGGAGNDRIENYGDNVSLIGGDGSDIIQNHSAKNVTIEGGKGNDAIQDVGNALIKYNAGDGNDSIRGFGENSTLSIAGAGCSTIKSRDDVIVYVDEDKITLRGAATLSTVNIVETPVNINNTDANKGISGTNLGDTIINSGEEVIIAAQGGDDSINNNAAQVFINGGEGADNISNVGKRVSVQGSEDNDIIYNNAEKDLIQGGTGDDSIFNRGEGVSIAGEAGNDTIENYGNSNEVSIAGGFGNDSIQNRSSKVTISGGWNYDTILSSGTANQIYGDENADLIILESSYKNTVNGGGGNDTIQLNSSSNNVLIQYDISGDNDLITGFNATSTLRLGDGKSTYARTDSGDDVIINYTDQNITLKGAAQLDKLHIDGVTKLNVNNTKNAVEIIGQHLDDSVVNNGKFVTISTNAGKDTISNSGLQVIIDGGDNSDTISNSGSQVSIAGGSDEDTISNTKGNFVTIDGGYGYDRISVSGGYKNVINGGLGNDSIYISPTERNALIKYKAGDGKDVIFGFNETSTLQLGNGNDSYDTLQRGNDIIVSVGDSSITLQGAASLSNVNILGVERGQNISNSRSNTVVSGKSGNDTITNGGLEVSISGGAGDDYISNRDIRNRGSRVTISGGDGYDRISVSDGYKNVISGGAGNDSIYISPTTEKNALIQYKTGDGNDYIQGFNNTSTLLIGSDSFSSVISGDDVIVSVDEDKITLRGAATLSTVNIVQAQEEHAGIVNAADDVSVIGTAQDDSISNSGSFVTVDALGGNDSITNTGFNGIIDAGAGDDSVVNEYGFFSSIAGGEGSDFITVSGSSQVTVKAGAGNDQISLKDNDETFIEYSAGDGSDKISGFDEMTTLNIAKSEYTSATSGGDIVLTVGDDKITLEGAATLSNVNISNGTYATFTIKDSGATCVTDLPDSVIESLYKFNDSSAVLTLDDRLKNYLVTVRSETASAKADWQSGSATLSNGSVLEYRLDDENNVTLTSKNYGDEISFSEDTRFNYGGITADVPGGSKLATRSGKAILFHDNSSANVTASRGYQIDVSESNITVNDVPINAQGGAGTVTVEKGGMKFEGYGAQFADLEVAKESYFGKLAPMTVVYNSADESYTLQNVACVKTLADDFTKLTLVPGDDTQANFKVNDKEFVVASTADNLNVIEANGNTFKIQGKELDAEKIRRVTIGEQLSFSGTEINFDGVKVNYAQNKPASYSLDGKTIAISDAATVTTSGDETKTITCAAGTYTINGKSFETTADLTFTADANQIKIPLTDAATEIYFDGVKISGVSNGGELVFDLAGDKVSIPNGATLNMTSPDEIKLNLAAGTYTINGNKISSGNALEITADKDSVKVPLGNAPVTINGANITGSDAAQIDNAKTIALPDGALVQNVTDNLFKLTAKNSAASFGTANKKVLLTDDGTAYIEFKKENSIGVGFNALMFEQVEILGNDAWTVETSGRRGIDKITGITGGATITTSTEYVDAGDLRFEVETDGAGDFTICGQKFTSTDDAKNIYVVRGNSNNEIKVSLLADEFKDDDSEAAGKTYQYDKAGDYTVNGITFHAEKGAKVQTVTHGVEFDLSTGKVKYDGLTISGKGTAQIDRYNSKLITLTDGAKVSGSDESKYFNRQFEITGTVEIGGKKFETDKQIRCALLNIQEALEGIPTPLTGFVVDDKYVAIQNDSYKRVKIVDGKIATIEGVKASAQMSGSGLANVSILTSGGGTFTINGAPFNVNNKSVGVIFQTDGSGNVSDIKWQRGTVTANFKNAIKINSRTIHLAGASSIKVTGNGENIEEISNVAGELVTTNGKTYRKNVRVYEPGGAEKLTTSADGTIIFNGDKFETSAGKTFTLDASGNVSEIGKAQSDELLSANVGENFVAMNLTTTDGLEEVIGDFSEGLMVNGVFVKVTESTNFVVKDDGENVYIETTAADLFTINGKTFETYADRTIFKLDASGNVGEIVTDKFYLYPDEETYLIEGDFNDEIIFNGKKICVTGTNDTSIFIGEETLIGIELARNTVKIVESGGATEIALSGGGELTIGDNTFSTSDDFIGFAYDSSIENFVGTLSGKLGGLELSGLTITTDDEFSATGDGEKITALDNLQNGSFTCGDLSGLTINGATISIANSEDFTATITDGVLTISGLKDSAIVENTGAAVSYTVEESGEFLIGETEFKLTGDNALTFTTDAAGIVKEISGLDENARLEVSAGGTYTVNCKELVAKANDTLIGLANNSARLVGTGEMILEELSGDDNAIVIDENSSGRINQTLSGGDLVIISGETTAKVSITASAGEDTIYSAGDNVSVKLGGGATKIRATGGKTTLENYDATTGAVLVTDYDNIFAAVKGGDIRFGRDKVSIGAAVVNVESNFLNFSDAAQNIQQVGFAYVDESLNAGGEKGDLILVGDSNSTLRGGSGDDSIYAGEDAHIDAGTGRNLVELSGDGGAIIELSGNTTVTGFTDDDALKTSTDNLKLRLDGDNLIAKNDSAKVTLADVAESSFAQISLVDGGETLKAYVAQDGENISASEAADIYFGKKSGVDFSAYDESLNIDLSKNFYGINQITVGGGLNTLISSSANETLTGNAEGTTQFIFDAGAGHDVIKNFNYVEDKISVGAAVSNVVLRNSGEVIIQCGDEWLTLEDAQGKNIQINDFVALVDYNITYDDAANYFLATSKNASVIVGEEAEIWLDGSHGKNFVGNIKTLDASNSDGKNTLAGNDADNIISAGGGDASLWGAGGNDLLVGGKSHNLFFYTSGNDTIQGANDGDAVILSNVTLDQISGTNFTSSGVAINFTGGGSLTIVSRADITYQLADGSSFSANHAQSVWQTK